MNAGIDFGTSNCSIGIWEKNEPNLLKLENESPLMASALYTSRTSIVVQEINEEKLRKRIIAAKQKQTIDAKKAREGNYSIKLYTDEELENQERGVMRHELEIRAKIEYENQSISTALYADTQTIFGETAIKRHLIDPQNGFFIKSPKSFLGSDIKYHQRELFSEIVTKMLAHIKSCAESQTGQVIENIVLGRPINFHTTSERREEGNEQAINILQGSAIAAGFKNIEFLFEPIAAALDYERKIEKDLIVLVLDVGGGTTDCSMIKIGPSYKEKLVRKNSILGYAGDRVGGIDVDIKLAMRKIMSFFGKETLLKTGLPVPNTVFWNAVSVNDVNAQAIFYSDKTEREIKELLHQVVETEKFNRLLRLQKERLSYRLNRSAELAKIHLSDRNLINLPLRYIEPDLVVQVSRQDLKDVINTELNKFLSLMQDVEKQSQTKPDVIYVTGGMAKSPIVIEYLNANFKQVDIVVGDLFGSVTSGLTTWAHRIFD